jgi:tetratricopeptide (TPR) repeat protein
VRLIRFAQSPPGFDRRHFIDEEDVKVVLARLPAETYERLTAVRFDDRGRAYVLGYVTRGRREINLCAQPPHRSLNGARQVQPEVFGALRGSQWPTLAVRRYLLYNTFLHELGHLQLVHPDERAERRRFAVEPQAQEFAHAWRKRLWAIPFDHPDLAHNPPSAIETATVRTGWVRSHAAYKRGLAADQHERYDEASTAFAEAIEHYPWHAPALERLGVCTYMTGNDAGAITLFRRAIAIDRRLYDANLYMAMALGNLGQHDAARAQYDQVLRITERGYLARLALGKFAQALGEWGANEEAERLFRSVLAKQPDAPLFLRDYARVVWKRDEQEALRLLERAVGLDPEDAITHEQLAVALLELGEEVRAKEHLEIVLRLRPTARAAELLEELRSGPQAS